MASARPAGPPPRGLRVPGRAGACSRGVSPCTTVRALYICISVLIPFTPIYSAAAGNGSGGFEGGDPALQQVFSELAGQVAVSQQNAIEGGAVSLTDSTYSEFMTAHPLTMVFFYAPWCYWSRSAMPEFDAAAKLLAHRDPPVILAKVDCTENEQVANKEDIREFPTMRLYIDGIAHPYEGRRFRTHIVHWVDARIDRDKTLASVAHLDELMGSSRSGHVAVVAAFPEGYNKTAFASVARAFGEDVFFADTADPAVIERLEQHILPQLPEEQRSSSETRRQLTPPYVAVFTPHAGEPQVHIYKGSVSEVSELRAYIRQWLYPVVSLFNADTISNSFFDDPRPKLVLLVDTARHAHMLQTAVDPAPGHPLAAAFRAAAERFRKFFTATVAGNTHQFEKQLMGILGAEDERLPLLRIMSVNHESDGRHHPAHKFKPSKPIANFTAKEYYREIETFAEDFLANRVNPYFRSETPPEQHEPRGRVRTVVAATFKQQIDSEDNVFIEFYAPWCGFCRKLEPAYKELAKRLAHIPNILIARIDATRNEVDGVKVSGYPTIFLYRRGEAEPLVYAGDRSTRDLLHWLSPRVKNASFDPEELLARDVAQGGEVQGSVLEEL